MATITEKQVLDALKVVRDPDLHRDIVELEFVKNIRIAAGSVKFDVQLTTPACPVKEDLKAQCIEAVNAIPGVTSVSSRMSIMSSPWPPARAGWANRPPPLI